MRVLDRYPVNEFGFDHSKALGCRITGPVKQPSSHRPFSVPLAGI
jgi:hypothetical protein